MNAFCIFQCAHFSFLSNGKRKFHPGILKKLTNFRQKGWIHQPPGYNGQQAGTNSVDTPNPPWKCSKPGSFLASPGCPGSVRPMLGLAQRGALAAPALQQWSSTTGLALRETSPSNLLQQNHTHNPPSSGDQGFQARLEVQHQFSITQK